MKMLKGILETIYREAEKEAPLEACGYLAGKEGVISTHYKMTNVDQSEIHYSFDPQEQFQVIKTVRNSGLFEELFVFPERQQDKEQCCTCKRDREMHQHRMDGMYLCDGMNDTVDQVHESLLLRIRLYGI